MKNFGEARPVINLFNRFKKTNNDYSLFLRSLLFTILFVAFRIVSQAQCTTPISNNTIVANSPICSASKAFLTGSIPSGGNGSFQYVWQVSDNNCGANSFTD